MSNVDWGSAPRDAEFFANGHFRKRVTGTKNPQKWILTGWTSGSWSLNECVNSLDYQPRPQQWPETDERIDRIGRDRTEDDLGHYNRTQNAPERTTSDESAKPKSKYHRIIKGVEIDLYDVLKAYGVTCPALAHAIKKAMLPGARHAKSFEQDIDEAIASMERAKELLSNE